ESVIPAFEAHELTCVEPMGKLGHRPRQELTELRGREPLEAEPMFVDGADVDRPAALVVVVARYLATLDDTCRTPHRRHHGLADGTPDVVEIYVGSIGEQGPHFAG